MKKGIAVALTVTAILVVPAIGFAWGEAGHRIIGEAAALSLPRTMPAFVRASVKQLAYLNPDPDRWRSRDESSIDPALDQGSAPDHFIDMDMVKPEVLAEALKAPNRYAYLDTLAAAGAKGSVMGLLPFRMLELSERLREEFRLWRAAPDSTKPFIEARIINDAGILGHYVADGSQPAHTTIEYNGWVGPNPNGYATDRRFHSRFESAFVQANVKLADVLPHVDTAARVLPDFRASIIAYLRETNGQVERMYQLDKAHPFDATTADSADKAFVVDRLAAGASMLRDIWWTAWVTSAKP